MDTWAYPKDPDAVLDYKFDWAPSTNGTGASDWLQQDELITSYAVTVPGGITVDSDEVSDDGTSIVIWLSGGTDGENYPIACRVSTNFGRTDERTRVLLVRSR